jgi:hypothetical protein
LGGGAGICGWRLGLLLSSYLTGRKSRNMSSRKKPVTKQIRAIRHAEAIKRDEEYQKLSFAEKLAKLPEGGAKRQRAKFAEKV